MHCFSYFRSERMTCVHKRKRALTQAGWKLESKLAVVFRKAEVTAE